MSRVAHWLLCGVVLLGAIRALSFAVYAMYMLYLPIPIHHCESTFVHFTWRVQMGAELYPAWEHYPHVNNFFAPCYFWLVGLLGFLAQASTMDLFILGRAVSLAWAIITAILIGSYLWHRCGSWAATVGALFGLGAAPMIGFSVMTRPDTMAACLGLSGFLAALSSSRGFALVSSILLSLAIMTKQNYGIYLIAAVFALLLSKRLGRALLIIGSTAFSLMVFLLLGLACGEPRLASAFWSEGQFPWEFGFMCTIVGRLLIQAPDLVVFSLVGLAGWIFGKERDSRFALLTAVLLLSSVISSAKLGSDLNYFLSLQAVQGLVAGTQWHAMRAQVMVRPRAMVAALLLALLAMGASVFGLATHVLVARNARCFFRTSEGDWYLTCRQIVIRLAQDPTVTLLTDSDLLAMHQGLRAAFLDAQDFRVLVESGVINPSLLRERLESGFYSHVILTADVNEPSYERYYLRLPAVLTESIRRNYECRGVIGQWFVFVLSGANRDRE
jgi:hypothetical protein